MMSRHPLAFIKTVALAVVAAATLTVRIAGTHNSASTANAPNDPSAVFAKYQAAVEGGDNDAVLALLSDDPMRPGYPACTSSLSNKDCLDLYLKDTVITQHTKFAKTKISVKNNAVTARLEVRSDLTRRFGVDRLLGTDHVEVVENKIQSLLFAANFTDAQTVQFFNALGIAPPVMP